MVFTEVPQPQQVRMHAYMQSECLQLSQGLTRPRAVAVCSGHIRD
jgi:hypothetical protein